MLHTFHALANRLALLSARFYISNHGTCNFAQRDTCTQELQDIDRISHPAGLGDEKL
jgi:hypothetical protein